MPSSYSSILRLEKQATGENDGTWGTKLNTVIDLIEASIAGVEAISTTGGDTTLTTNNGAADQGRKAILSVTGTLVSNAVIIIPNLSKTYVVYNGTTGAFTLSIKTASGSAVTLTQGHSAIFRCDGSDVVTKVTKTAFLELSDAPTSFSGQGGKVLKVNSGATAIEFDDETDQSEFASGTALIFPQATAPSFWTKTTSVDDRVLRIVSGGTGGTSGGTWTISGLDVGDTSPSVQKTASHNHAYTDRGDSGIAATPSGTTVADNTSSSYNTDTSGGDQAHDHSISHDGDWRPAYYSVIRATKD